MKKQFMRPFICAFTVAVVHVALLSSARANPAFARRYKTSCTQCHHTAYPRLNQFGWQFKENGYQYPEGAEDPYRAKAMEAPGTIVERLNLFREAPVAVRIQNEVIFAQDEDTAQAAGQNRSDFNFPSQAYLIGGGSLFNNVSGAFSFSFAPEPDLHYMTLGVHNLFGEGWLNVRLGKFFLIDFMRPQHRRLTRHPHVPAQVSVGKNPFFLDSHQQGIDIWGRPNRGPFFYRVAVVHGVQAHGQPFDLDDYKDVYTRVSYRILDQHTLGLMGYAGKATIDDTTNGVQMRFGDRFYIGGVDAEMEFGPVIPYLHFIMGRHGNPSGTDESVLYYAAHGELTWSITRDWVGILVYHQVFSDDDKSLEQTHIIPHLSYLFLRNFKLGVEYVADVKDFDRSQIFLLAEAIF